VQQIWRPCVTVTLNAGLSPAGRLFIAGKRAAILHTPLLNETQPSTMMDGEEGDRRA